MEDRPMPFWEHLIELRRRLLVALAALLLTSICGYIAIRPVYGILLQPLGTGELVALSPGEAFATDIRISAFVGALLSVPVLILELLLFVRPALRASERWVICACLGMTIAFYLGIAVGYVFILPRTLDLLLTLGRAPVRGMFSVSRYVRFVMSVLISSAVVLEIPVILVILAAREVIPLKTLKARQGQAFLAIMFFVAVITPTGDAITLLILGLPLAALWFISLHVMDMLLRKRSRVIEAEITGR